MQEQLLTKKKKCQKTQQKVKGRIGRIQQQNKQQKRTLSNHFMIEYSLNRQRSTDHEWGFKVMPVGLLVHK